MSDSQTEIFVALGTNMGDRKANLETAVERLGEVMTVTGRSRLYQSAPMYVTDQPAFLNMVVGGETDLAPAALLAHLKHLEAELGRRPTFRNGPRMIDLDVLYYDDQVIDTPDLVVPHPRIAERSFVLWPLNDIAADLHDPRQHRRVSEMYQALADADDIRVYTG